MQMPIPANRALVPFRPFMIVRVADYDEEPAEIRTYASREACERGLFDWIGESVVHDEISGGAFDPGSGWYTFAACENGEVRHWRSECPQGIRCHFGPWPEEEEAALRRATAGLPWPF